MDLAVVYRSIVKKQFPRAKIVADRFHVIRLVNHHFLACWRDIDPVGSKHRGLVSLMRRHRHNLKPEQKLRLLTYRAEQPALDLIYRFKQRLCYLLLKKHKTRKQCQKLIHVLFQAAFANFNPHAATAADFEDHGRAPLLLIAGGDDHVSPASVVEANFKLYSKSKAVTEYRNFPGRTHYTLGQEGWEEVADYALSWAESHAQQQAASAL